MSAAHPLVMSTQTRQPAGAPTGGQFAATIRPEGTTTLTGTDRDALTDRMVDALVSDRFVTPDSQDIGYSLNDVDEVATVTAATALDLADDEHPSQESVAAARAVIVDTLTPDPEAKFWTGTDMYWTDDLHGLCGRIADAVQAQRRR